LGSAAVHALQPEASNPAPAGEKPQLSSRTSIATTGSAALTLIVTAVASACLTVLASAPRTKL
jgi:hypothetical protein